MSDSAKEHILKSPLSPPSSSVAQAKEELLAWIYSIAGGLIADPAQFEAERQQRVNALIAAVSSQARVERDEEQNDLGSASAPQRSGDAGSVDE